MRKKIKAPSLVILAFLTVLTALAWVGFEVYRALTTQPPPIVPQETLAPVDPNLDVTTLSKLQQRIHIDDANLPENVIATPTPIQSEPTPTVEPTPTLIFVEENETQ